MNLVGPLEVFVDEEPDAKPDGDEEQPQAGFALAPFQHPDGEHHGQTAREQDPRVDRPHFRVEVQRGIMEVGRVFGSVDCVQQEHPAEQQQLGKQKQPHGDLRAGRVRVIFVTLLRISGLHKRSSAIPLIIR